MLIGRSDGELSHYFFAFCVVEEVLHVVSLLLLGNNVASAEALVADNVTLKSCSIDEMFA